MGYISRYIREHYVRRNIRKELYDRFIKWCGEASINLCLEKALKILETNIGANIAPNIGANTASQTTTVVKAQPRERRHVIVFTHEWARERKINVEEYMARKEREGYLCNETSREVVCIWRELLEEIVVELNKAGVGFGELDRALSGEKLDTARVAQRAGLLWFDFKDKRWRAPL
jgi:hypothetical protein